MISRTCRAFTCAAVLSAAAFTLSACSGSSNPVAAATTLAPGANQSLAGMPGASGTGAAPSDTAMPGMTMTAGAGSSAPAAPASGDAVMIQNFAFSPAALVVKAGTTVTWTNRDTDAHTVTSQNNTGPLGSSPLANGQSYSYTFTKPGTYNYLCTIHPFMTATVTVTP